jgi:hypothetical protein
MRRGAAVRGRSKAGRDGWRAACRFPPSPCCGQPPTTFVSSNVRSWCLHWPRHRLPGQHGPDTPTRAVAAGRTAIQSAALSSSPRVLGNWGGRADRPVRGFLLLRENNRWRENANIQFRVGRSISSTARIRHSPDRLHGSADNERRSPLQPHPRSLPRGRSSWDWAHSMRHGDAVRPGGNHGGGFLRRRPRRACMVRPCSGQTLLGILSRRCFAWVSRIFWIGSRCRWARWRTRYQRFQHERHPATPTLGAVGAVYLCFRTADRPPCDVARIRRALAGMRWCRWYVPHSTPSLMLYVGFGLPRWRAWCAYPGL